MGLRWGWSRNCWHFEICTGKWSLWPCYCCTCKHIIRLRRKPSVMWYSHNSRMLEPSYRKRMSVEHWRAWKQPVKCTAQFPVWLRKRTAPSRKRPVWSTLPAMNMVCNNAVELLMANVRFNHVQIIVGWLFKLKLTKTEELTKLMSEQQYADFLKNDGH